MKEIEVLREINKNARVGINGIELTLEKAVDSNFKDVLYTQKNGYENIFNITSKLLQNLDEPEEEVPMVQKAMAWMGVEFSTLTNTSNSKLAEILIQGNDMGIIKGTKLLHNMEADSEEISNPEIQNILKDFIKLQQENIEGLKKFL